MTDDFKQEDLAKLPFMNPKLDLETRVEDLFSRLTFDEKLLLCAGEKDNSTAAIPRLGIKPFRMTDGPHGIAPYAFRNAVSFGADHMPVEKVEGGTGGMATYFPTGIQMGSTWNPELIQQFGVAIGEEMRAIGWHMILGPAFNICRTPLNGRTFEYYSEDPLLSGELAAAAVKGIQSMRIAPCIKHYTANNCETNRFKVNEIISRRTLEEIYLAGFKRCVQKSDPWGLMSSYNKINGTYVSEHKEILRSFLKDDWGFSGIVVSDWGATNHVTGINELIEAGLDIEMGSRNRYNIATMQQMKAAQEFPDAYFDDMIRRILRAMFRVGIFDDPTSLPQGKIKCPEHYQLARKMAEEGMILLKNENNLLPLQMGKVKKIALLGKHADTKFGRSKLGGGSSAVFPPYEITIRQGLEELCKGKIDLIDDAAAADVAIVCIGLEHSHDFKGGDHEGSDRLRYGIGPMLTNLVLKTLKQNKNTIVVIVGGSVFDMEKFADKVPAILEAWYGGLEIGHVVADILFGNVNPSGKLPISWPKHKKDIPTALSFWNTIIPVKEIEYKEGVFVGYRYYDSNNISLRYPFGYGLSYTNFKYENLKLNTTKLVGNSKLIVQFDLINIGSKSGKDVAQLYIHDKEASVARPIKELKAFQKVLLNPGERKTISFELTKDALAFFDEKTNTWIAENGEFRILIGNSIQNIPLEFTFTFQN